MIPGIFDKSISLIKQAGVLISLFILLVTAQSTYAAMPTHLLDNDFANWKLITDGVMGGVSQGTIKKTGSGDTSCVSLTGTVSTENNGGFIQIAYDIDKPLSQKIKQYQGILVTVRGNGEKYNVHLRTSDLWFPWQAFRSTFTTDGKMETIKLPFDSFTAYKTGQALKVENLKRIGIVAIGREFNADICVASLGFYAE